MYEFNGIHEWVCMVISVVVLCVCMFAFLWMDVLCSMFGPYSLDLLFCMCSNFACCYSLPPFESNQSLVSYSGAVNL